MKSLHFYLIFILLSLLTLFQAPAAHGFDRGHWAETSVLADGNWVKVSVKTTGVHLISVSDLRAWGFADPARVKVYGYGGRRISDHLMPENYVDDLPGVQSILTSRGIVFYGIATETPEYTADDEWRFSSLNPYSTVGYYYLSDREDAESTIPMTGSAPSGTPAETFIESLRHEVDQLTPAESGHLLLGEDFRFNNTQIFPFNLTDRVEGTDVWMQCDFFARSISQPLRLTFKANDSALPSLPADRVKATSEYGDSCRIRKTFPLQGEKLNLTIGATLSGSVTVAALDNLTICYTRRLRLPTAGTLSFTLTGSTGRLTGVASGASLHLWDVTDPLDIKEVKVTREGENATWTNDYFGKRDYAAWLEAGSMPSPAYVATVKNQNIHAAEVPQMVIVTHPDMLAQSQRVARLHAESADALDVLVVSDTEVYNEFSSGSPDVNAIRKMLKMFYDRDPERLTSVMLMGAVSHDHRRLTQAMASSRIATLPIWQTDNSRSESTSYSSDDFITFLKDGSGLKPGSDVMSIAVGRLPARNASDAKIWVDRLEKYLTSPAAGDWRNRIVLLADDEDDGIHATQTEDMWTNMLTDTDCGPRIIYQKIYLDAYEKNAGVTKAAREKFYNLLNDGVIWWNYVGHASVTNLTNEGMMTLQDLSSLYLRKPPFFYGATCSFGHWDGMEFSGLEQLLLSDAGGLIGGITAVRPVYISNNGILTRAMGAEVFNAGPDGALVPVGEAMRRAKNRLASDSNKLRYVFMGDPAMRLALPAMSVALDSIGGIPVDPSPDAEQCIIPALAPVRLAGRVLTPDGQVDTSFDGTLSLSIYDAERSVTSLGRLGNEPVTFDVMGERIYVGRTKVTAGEWSTSVIIPAEIADNFRQATISLFASADNGSEAAGVNRDFYVYGLDDNAVTDDKAPEINTLHLNHPDFRVGDTVNDTPMLIANVSDDTGLNLSTSGVGHQMTIRLDDSEVYSDVSLYFTPDESGLPAGDIAYQLPALKAGNHTATLKVWDIAGNSSSRSIEFFVDPTVAPKIFDVYSDANPATTEARFFVEHNRPDAMLEVKVEILDLGGHLVWSNITRGRADMYSSQPVVWNLTGRNGGKVNRGIYLYRTTVSSADTPEAASSVVTKRIAVAP